MSVSPLDSFFQPSGVAVIGASNDPGKLGFSLARNLFECGYPGAVHLVNPKGGTLRNKPMYRTIDEVPNPVDLAVILIRAAAVPRALEECAERGIDAAIIASAGFGEASEEGKQIELQCRRVAAERGLRILGPNCIGVVDTHYPIDTTFLNSGRVPEGNIAFVSHSGAMCAAIIDMSRTLRLGWSRIISLGNQVDLTETDMLEPLTEDPDTAVVAMYLEGLSDGVRFVQEARRLTLRKPVVALKAGRSEAGRRAVASHTAALAGEDAVFEAAFRRAGVIRAETTEELFDIARTLSSTNAPAGRRVAVLTNAGGPGVTAVDAIDRAGLVVAKISDASVQALTDLLPDAASVANPVDMLASASAEDYGRAFEILASDPGVDSILVILPPPPHYPPEDVIAAFEGLVEPAAKPVVVALMGGEHVERAARRLDAAEISYFRFPEPAVCALAALVERREILERANQPIQVEERRLDLATLKAGLAGESGFLRSDRAAEIAKTCGIATAPIVFGENPESAARAAARVEFPIAIKVLSRDILHKSRVGGVRLGIASRDQVEPAATELLQVVRSNVPGATVEGFLVQSMQPDGLDVVVGAVRDPQFGPVVMFGAGGGAVEQEGDVTFELAAVNSELARSMVGRTRIGKRLVNSIGARPSSPSRRAAASFDVDAVVEAIQLVSELVTQVPDIVEFEINPLRVFEQGEGVVAIDVRCGKD